MVRPITAGMNIQVGYWRWKLFRWNDHPNPYRNRSDLALTWLQQFQNDPVLMAEMQRLLGSSLTGLYTPGDPQSILRQIADKMATGEVLACVDVCGPIALVDAGGAGQAEQELEPVPVVPPPPPAPAPTAPVAETQAEPTLGPNSDAAAQAEVMKQAAQDGAPFCEECQKAAAEAQKKAPKTPVEEASEPDTFSPDTEPVAQAQALKRAAQKGVPYCAECEKARQELNA